MARHSSSLLQMLVLLLCITGGHSLVVKSSVGDDAVLPCEVGPITDPTIVLADLTIEWSRPGLPGNVYYQRNGAELDATTNPSYKGRTSLSQEEVKKGNVSLKLTRVKTSDEGIYTCQLPEINKNSTVHLTVESSSDGPGPGRGHTIIIFIFIIFIISIIVISVLVY